MNEELRQAIDQIPVGAWGVGVSGGADSVALLSLLRARADLLLHVIHLDHETRGAESTADAIFVAELCSKWNVPCLMARRSEIEASRRTLPSNRSARFRALRIAYFTRVVDTHDLDGVILAHHAEDQVETIFQRLARGSGSPGLVGMSARARLNGLRILRPLLGVRRTRLREYLRSIDQSWREDSSNASDHYLRNRIRRILSGHEALHDRLLELSAACRVLRHWTRAQAPTLTDAFNVAALQDLPAFITGESAARWLIGHGVPRDQLSPSTIARLLEMANDAASAHRQHFPGAVLVQRRRGRLRRAAD